MDGSNESICVVWAINPANSQGIVNNFAKEAIVVSGN